MVFKFLHAGMSYDVPVRGPGKGEGDLLPARHHDLHAAHAKLTTAEL